MEYILVSACLLGISTRYDGKSIENKEIVDLLKDKVLIPVCPEIYGGLPTPRPPAEIVRDKVINNLGIDVTKEYSKGAEETLKIAKLFNAKKAILKSKSPSCGCGKIYDGSFSKTLIDGDGITAKLLKENGIEVINEENLDCKRL